MEIDINQSKISLGAKYDIYVDGQQRHNASSKIFSLLSVIELYEWDSELPKITINKKFDLFLAKYDLTKQDRNVYEFRTKSYWKGHYQCLCGFDMYDIYAHRWRKYSVYKNDVQVAWWTKQAVSWFSGDNYKIIADNKCDYNLIISFCLIMDNFKNEGKERMINFDIGKLGPQAKKFDPYWQPK